MNQRAVVKICAKKCALRLYAPAQVEPFHVCPLGHVGVVDVDGGGVEVVSDETHADPFQYCPEEQVVVVVEGGGVYDPQSAGHEAADSALSQEPLPQTAPDPDVDEELTHDVPFQYCPEEQVVAPVDCGELQHPPLYQYQPEEAHIDES